MGNSDVNQFSEEHYFVYTIWVFKSLAADMRNSADASDASALINVSFCVKWGWNACVCTKMFLLEKKRNI